MNNGNEFINRNGILRPYSCCASLEITLLELAYQDSDNTLDFDINDPTITLTGDVTGSATMTNLGSVSIATTRTAGSTSTADIADNAVTEAKVVNDAISRAKLKDEVSLLIINAAGSTVKTMYGAGS